MHDRARASASASGNAAEHAASQGRPGEPELTARLAAAGLDPASVAELARAALAEDLGGGSDVTTRATIAPGLPGAAALVARTAGVLAGLPVAEAVLRAAAELTGSGPAPRPGAGSAAAGSAVRPEAVRPGAAPAPVTVHYLAADGDVVVAGQVLLTVHGRVAAILTGERTALNLLCHLSGVATLTRRWVDAVAGTGAQIRDTRKTLPGLRALEKYAVRCGGGVNHRMSLADAALIKDNHVAAAGSVSAAFAAVRAHAAGVPVEVECDTLGQVAEALAAGADLILLDNFTVAQMTQAVRLARGRARLEASGGLTLAAARAVAETGVDYLAVGALTHSAPALDIALDLAGPDSDQESHAADH
jgi:nicotinate-nucleotide pyrophosphorylase (carboxylating)